MILIGEYSQASVKVKIYFLNFQRITYFYFMQPIEKKSNTPRYRLTKLGEQMARLPIDPKIARILLAAKKHDCMAEILVIASALSIQDPRERTLRTRLRRRVYPTVFRRRFQQPHRIHRPRNRPQQPGRRHPAHGGIETRRRSSIPIFRNARFAVYQ